MRSSECIIKSITQKVMAKSGIGCRYHELKYFEVGFFCHIPCIHYKLKGFITKICGKTSIYYSSYYVLYKF